MKFPPLLRYALLVPVLALLLPYLYALTVMWSDSGSSLQQRGVGVLLAVAAIATGVELVAVPAALYRLASTPECRTVGNVVMLLAAIVPMAFLGFAAFVILYGHG